MKNKEKRKYDIAIDGYKIRNDADLDRVDMSRPQKSRHHRKLKLEKRDWYKQVYEELIDEIRRAK